MLTINLGKTEVNELFLYFCDAERLFMRSSKSYVLPQTTLESMQEIAQFHVNVDGRIHNIFPNFPKITIDAISAYLGYDPRTDPSFAYF